MTYGTRSGTGSFASTVGPAPKSPSTPTRKGGGFSSRSRDMLQKVKRKDRTGPVVPPSRSPSYSVHKDMVLLDKAALPGSRRGVPPVLKSRKNQIARIPDSESDCTPPSQPSISVLGERSGSTAVPYPSSHPPTGQFHRSKVVRVELGADVYDQVSEIVWDPLGFSFTVPKHSTSLAREEKTKIHVEYENVSSFIELKDPKAILAVGLRRTNGVPGVRPVQSIEDLKRLPLERRVSHRILLVLRGDAHLAAMTLYPCLEACKYRVTNVPDEVKLLTFWQSDRVAGQEHNNIKGIFQSVASKARSRSPSSLFVATEATNRKAAIQSAQRIAERHSAARATGDDDVPRRQSLRTKVVSWEEGTYVTYPPRHVDAPSRVTIYPGDVKLLKPSECLNDTLIEYFQKRVMYEKLSDEKRKRMYFFNSFFLQRLTNTVTEDRYRTVARWTKGENLFEKSVVVIAINESHHWKLMVLFNLNLVTSVFDKVQQARAKSPSARRSSRTSDAQAYDAAGSADARFPFVLFFDSLGGGVDDVLRGAMADYLSFAYADQYPDRDVPPFRDRKFLRSPRVEQRYVPTQRNAVDCGMYVLMYMERLAELVNEDRDQLMTDENINNMIRLQQWTTSIKPQLVRRRRDEERHALDVMYQMQNVESRRGSKSNSDDSGEESSGDLEIVEKSPKRQKRTRNAAEVSRRCD